MDNFSARSSDSPYKGASNLDGSRSTPPSPLSHAMTKDSAASRSKVVDLERKAQKHLADTIQETPMAPLPIHDLTNGAPPAHSASSSGGREYSYVAHQSSQSNKDLEKNNSVNNCQATHNADKANMTSSTIEGRCLSCAMSSIKLTVV